ncbi:AAA domain-containing protein [uncultured Martelella sp.]|uniref:AAA domain-containing protein n=1 Tax=uncultured Martelella sp. TaxID=392331 RepID=UPI0029C72251|nr:AAA domain-containing protein [uncultured Martelella sp.]
MRLSHSRFSGNEKTPRFKCSAGHCFRIIVLKTTVELRPQLLRSWKRIPFVEARFFEPLNTIEVTRRFEEHLRKLREAKLSPEEREKEDWQRAADTVTRKDHARIRRRVDRLEQNRHRASGFSHLKADDRQQIEMLSSGVELRRITVSGRDGMTIGTVHALQGAERPVVIFSPVYSKHADGGFIDASPSMLNVTVSRAKDSFLVFGDMDVLATARSGSPRALLSEFLATKGKALDFAMEPREDLTRGEARIEMLQQAAEHDAFLLDALRGEGRRYVIVSPWVVAGTIERTGLLDAMATARQRGAEIEVFADPLLNTGPAAGGLSQIEAVKSRLSEIGVAMHRVPKLHSKIVTVDKDLLCAGSFNWLSADRNGQYARHETSFVYRGPHLEEEIKIIRAGLLHRAE